MFRNGVTAVSCRLPADSHRLRAGAAAFDEEGLADGGAATGFEDVFDGV